MARLEAIVPDLLASRSETARPLTLIVDWQELQTVGQTTLAVA